MDVRAIDARKYFGYSVDSMEARAMNWNDPYYDGLSEFAVLVSVIAIIVCVVMIAGGFAR